MTTTQDLLDQLQNNAGKTLPHRVIAMYLYDIDIDTLPTSVRKSVLQSIRFHICELRKDDHNIRTITGLGYRYYDNKHNNASS